MTKLQLFSLLTSKSNPTVTIKGHTGVLSAIEREDGSGNCFNLTLNMGTTEERDHTGRIVDIRIKTQNVFVRTVD